MEPIIVKSGQDVWAVIIHNGSTEFCAQAVETCIRIAREKWPEERLYVEGMDSSTVEKIKKRVNREKAKQKKEDRGYDKSKQNSQS